MGQWFARSFGARIFDFAWIDSFAAARNEALSHAKGDYAFWLDADDVVEPRELEKLRAILASLRAGEQVAYVVRCACDPSPDGTGGSRTGKDSTCAGGPLSKVAHFISASGGGKAESSPACGRSPCRGSHSGSAKAR